MEQLQRGKRAAGNIVVPFFRFYTFSLKFCLNSTNTAQILPLLPPIQPAYIRCGVCSPRFYPISAFFCGGCAIHRFSQALVLNIFPDFSLQNRLISFCIQQIVALAPDDCFRRLSLTVQRICCHQAVPDVQFVNQLLDRWYLVAFSLHAFGSKRDPQLRNLGADNMKRAVIALHLTGRANRLPVQ